MFVFQKGDGVIHHHKDIDTAVNIICDLTGKPEDRNRLTTVMNNMIVDDSFETDDVYILYMPDEDGDV